MSSSLIRTKTKTGVLVDDVRESPVDVHLHRVHRWVFWVILALVLALLIL